MKFLKDKRKKRSTDNVVENKRKVEEALKEKKIDFAIDTSWAFIGPFMKFLESTGIMKGLKGITGGQIRKMLAPHIFILLYILKIIIGIPKIRGSEKLLGDLGAMNLVGLNVDSLMDGLCKRGDANQHGKGYKKTPCVMDVFTLLDNVEKCYKCKVMKAFNDSVRSFRGMLRSGTYALDSTIIETKPDFPGCGKTKRKKEGRNNDPPEYEYIYGFKLFVLYEVKSRIIVAMYIVPANEDDHKYFLPMVKQGIHNCGRGSIQLVIADRGFLNGAHLWELKHKMGIDFIIPAKAGMIIREDAIGLRKMYEGKPLAEWAYGKGKCQGYGVNGLRSYLEYNIVKYRSNPFLGFIFLDIPGVCLFGLPKIYLGMVLVYYLEIKGCLFYILLKQDGRPWLQMKAS